MTVTVMVMTVMIIGRIKKMLEKKMTKKALKEYYKSQRSVVALGKNLGTRTMKSAKYPNRTARKADLRNCLA